MRCYVLFFFVRFPSKSDIFTLVRQACNDKYSRVRTSCSHKQPTRWCAVYDLTWSPHRARGGGQRYVAEQSNATKNKTFVFQDISFSKMYKRYIIIVVIIISTTGKKRRTQRPTSAGDDRRTRVCTPVNTCIASHGRLGEPGMVGCSDWFCRVQSHGHEVFVSQNNKILYCCCITAMITLGAATADKPLRGEGPLSTATAARFYYTTPMLATAAASALAAAETIQ